MAVRGGKSVGHIKAGGRVKGTPNKATQDLLEIWAAIKYDPATAINDLIPQLEPEKQVDVHLKLMDYEYPKRRAVEHSGPEGGAINVNNSAPSQHVQALVQMVEGLRNEIKPK